MRLLSILLMSNWVSCNLGMQLTTADAFSIEISAPAVVKPYSDVLVRIRLSNNQAYTVNLGTESFIHGQLDTRFKYDCWDQDRRSVKRDYQILGSMGDRAMIILKPTESHEEEVNVATACDLNKPGQYQIQLSRGLPNSPEQQDVKSKQITVMVVR